MKKEGLFRFGKFLISSGISCLVDMGLFALLNALLGRLGLPLTEAALVMIATIIARICSSICNYMINRKAVFKSDDKKSIIRYYILAACQMLVSGGCVAGLVAIIHWLIPALATTTMVKTVVKGIVDFLLFFISYKIQKEWVFKNE